MRTRFYCKCIIFLNCNYKTGGKSGQRLLDGSCGQGIPEDQNDGIAAQEHLRDEAVLVHRLHLLLALAGTRHLSPHLLDVLQDHVAMPVKGFDASQQLLVVSAVDQHLRVVLHGLGEHREWSSVELLLFLLGQLFRGQFRLGFCQRPDGEFILVNPCDVWFS